MSKTRVHVESRITDLANILAPPQAVPQPPPQLAVASTSLPTDPPTYEESVVPPPTYSQSCAGQPNTMRRSETSDSVSSGEQGEILFSMAGVQVFHVSADGEVTTPSYPETLHLIKLDRERDRSAERRCSSAL